VRRTKIRVCACTGLYVCVRTRPPLISRTYPKSVNNDFIVVRVHLEERDEVALDEVEIVQLEKDVLVLVVIPNGGGKAFQTICSMVPIERQNGTFTPVHV